LPENRSSQAYRPSSVAMNVLPPLTGSFGSYATRLYRALHFQRQE
jgi:hypothetical protein